MNRPVITRSSSDSYPVYIAWFSYEKAGDADRIREAYEAVSGVGEVELGGRKKKELMVELHSGRLAGMALPGEALGSMLRSSNLACKVAMPGGQTLVLSSRLSSASDFGQVQVSPELKLSDIARLEYKDAESQILIRDLELQVLGVSLSLHLPAGPSFLKQKPTREGLES